MACFGGSCVRPSEPVTRELFIMPLGLNLQLSLEGGSDAEFKKVVQIR